MLSGAQLKSIELVRIEFNRNNLDSANANSIYIKIDFVSL